MTIFGRHFWHTWEYRDHYQLSHSMLTRGVIKHRKCIKCGMEQIKKSYYSGWKENAWKLRDQMHKELGTRSKLV